MSANVELRIPKTSSTNLPKALEIAETFERFSTPSDKSEPYSLMVIPEELCTRHQDVEQLYDMARGWKGTQLRINGRLGDWKALRTVLDVFHCADQKSNAIIPEHYCQPKHEHGWGCKRLTTIQEGLPRHSYQLQREYGYWFCFGNFSEDNSYWVIDKPKLIEALNREAATTHIDMCPFFIPSVVEERVNALPDKIELDESSSWEILFDEMYDDSTIQKIPIGITPKYIDQPHQAGFSISVSSQEEEAHPAQSHDRTIPEVSFADIGGVDDILGMVREVIELPLRHPALFKHLGISPHKGILLHGPPGCGKTLIAKAIANEIQAHFISIRGPELFTKWFGESESNLRAVFSEARKLAPSIIFFDEIDAIAQTRSGEESIRHESRFVNQLLTLMDGMETYENVCVIASTNRPELLDAAIMRPGRFDYTLEIKRPSPEGCLRIFQIHTQNMPLAPSVELEETAARMSGFSGAEIAFVAREAAYNCLRRCGNAAELITQAESDLHFEDYFVEQSDFDKAFSMIHNNENNA